MSPGPNDIVYYNNMIYMLQGNCVYTVDTTNSYKLTRIAGTDAEGYSGDGGQAINATFRKPMGITVNPIDGTIYISDTDNNVIRVINPQGIISTLAGNLNPGSMDGRGVNAQLYAPRGLSLRNDGTILYFCDSKSHKIRAITIPGGDVTTIAGTSGYGYEDGPGLSARFYNPGDLILNRDNSILYVCDTVNNKIRSIELSTNTVSTVAQNLSYPTGSIFNSDGTILYFADHRGPSIRALNISTRNVTTIALGEINGIINNTNPIGLFKSCFGVAINNNMIYVTDNRAGYLRAMLLPPTVATGGTRRKRQQHRRKSKKRSVR
jgi:sugar lactone lactonase YvrE